MHLIRPRNLLIVLTVLLFTGLQYCRTPILADDGRLALPKSDEGLPGHGPIRRYDWFTRLWEQRRTEFAARCEREQNAVVFLGDSITQGWGDNLSSAFPGLTVANRGISGDTTRGMLLRLKQDVIDVNPQAVVLLMGTNDLEEGAAPDVIAGNLKLILQGLHEHRKDLPVILCNVFPSSASKKRPADSIQQINRLYAEAVRGDSRVTVVDTWTLFANSSGDAKPEEFPDLLHPNKAGYDKWAAALTPVLATLGLIENDVEPFTPDDGFTSLFNGHDLTGWCFRPTTEAMLKARERWHSRDPNAPPWPVVTEQVNFEGVTASPDGRYVARNGRLIVTTPAEGRRIQQLWTTKEFGSDFVLRLQFRATPNADSGVFVRDPQLQCRDYILAGPYKELKTYRPQQWNDLEVVVTGNVARCTCNGELLEAEFKVPETGPIGLEGDRGQMEYRHIQIQVQ
ncbi:MAG: DUF1080 domain-containing protein [Planctomycetaceae bacterium]|nr:DUF1080 domain-containing protein [Planctomycetaceae bacterium]